jgi:uncharacterized cupredoxin-like copper-binding protein
MKRIVVLLLACAPLLLACEREDASIRRIVVDINHSRFDPGDIETHEGSIVTFVIRNNDPIDHEFIIGDDSIQLVHEKGTEAHHGARPGEISVPAGETRTTVYEFNEAGKLIYGCHLPGHYDYGMKGSVTISA